MDDITEYDMFDSVRLQFGALQGLFQPGAGFPIGVCNLFQVNLCDAEISVFLF